MLRRRFIQVATLFRKRPALIACEEIGTSNRPCTSQNETNAYNPQRHKTVEYFIATFNRKAWGLWVRYLIKVIFCLILGIYKPNRNLILAHLCT